MAVPPTIPTSFVPPAPSARTARVDIGGAFSFIALSILAIAVLGAGGIFGYQKYLESVKASGDATVVADQQKIDAATIGEFVHLEQRIDTAKQLLAGHLAPSALLDLFGDLTPASVRFSSFKFSASETAGAYKVTAAGTGASFNALAVASASFSASPKLKNPIFSSLTLNKDGSIGFSLTADVPTDLVAATAAALGAGAPSATGTTTPKAASTTLPTP